MRSNIESRLVSLEARQLSAKSDSQKFVEKCTDTELHELEKIAIRTENGHKELTEEEAHFLEDLVAKYGQHPINMSHLPFHDRLVRAGMIPPTIQFLRSCTSLGHPSGNIRSTSLV